MKNKLWINALFNRFLQESSIDIYFEEKDKLKTDKKVLNLSIHPIRFADDVFFNFETNDEILRNKLKKYEVNYDLFYHYADLVKATYLKTVKKNEIKENSLLLVGQTERDKVIFNGKKHLSLLDYIDTIKSFSKGYENIYFKPHPYAKNNKQTYKALKKEFPNITMVYQNIYHLLSNENIKYIVGLNSSVLYEAKYFKKEVTFLYEHTFEIGGTDIGIYGDYFNSSFWANILNTKDLNTALPFTESRLRKAVNDFWGYNEVSDEIVLKDILKSKIKYLLSKYL